MKTIPDQRFDKDYKQDEHKQKTGWITFQKEAEPEENKGDLIFSKGSWFEYQRNLKRIYLLLVLFFGFTGPFIFIMPNIILIRILGFGLFFLAVIAFYLIIVGFNWFAIYENGIQPLTIPIKYVKEKKRFIPYSEIDSIEILLDKTVMEIHEWEFRFIVNDGYQFSISYHLFNDSDKLYKVLKSISENC